METHPTQVSIPSEKDKRGTEKQDETTPQDPTIHPKEENEIPETPQWGKFGKGIGCGG